MLFRSGSSAFFFGADFAAGLPPAVPAVGFAPTFDFVPVAAGFLAAEAGLGADGLAVVFVVVVVVVVVFG